MKKIDGVMSRGKHMRSMEQVVKWVMWIYGSGGLGLASQDNRFGSQQKVEMEILQRKCTKWKKNRKWQNLPIILKFLRIPHLNPKWKEGFFSYFSLCYHFLFINIFRKTGHVIKDTYFFLRMRFQNIISPPEGNSWSDCHRKWAMTNWNCTIWRVLF